MTDHALIPEHFQLENLEPGRLYCICGEVVDASEGTAIGLANHLVVVRRVNKVEKIKQKMRDTVKYYEIYDYPGSYYDRPNGRGAASLTIHWTDLKLILEELDKVTE